MEKILGVDFGERKIGLAIGDSRSRLAEPYKVLRVKDVEEAVEKIIKVIKIINIIKVIIGVSEGKSEKNARDFGERLRKESGLEIILQDETLSTREAQIKSIEAGIKRKRRKSMEDAYAATIILQSYLEAA